MCLFLCVCTSNATFDGRYVFLVTLYDRIGGSPLFWTEAGLNGSSVGLPGATDPVRHKGRYVLYIGCTCCVTSSTEQIMKIQARITLGVDVIRAF